MTAQRAEAPTTLVWFRADLRLRDNPALMAGLAGGGPVVALFVLEASEAGGRLPGAASQWWLHHSLTDLRQALRELNIPLLFRRGSAADVVPVVAAEAGAAAVVWNRLYDPAAQPRDAALKAALKEQGLAVQSYNASLLLEPWTITNGTGGPFKVFTPYSKAVRAGLKLQELTEPTRPQAMPKRVPGSDTLADWGLLPTKPDWSGGLANAWTPGEDGALAALSGFIEARLQGYAVARNLPGVPSTSRLSPYLRWGEVSPWRVWLAAAHAAACDPRLEDDVFVFHQELLWREFSHHLLHQAPKLATENWRQAFDRVAWRIDPAALKAWQRGRTGYPIVDAGMRELWTTGWMHNRVRMIVASVLTKHLLIDWREGEAWFWDTLVDACPANNPASWQWTAGSGADAAPYFRVFNPVTQGEKFDAQAAYIRRWVPELARLSDKAIHAPWAADSMELRKAGVTLGVSYPHPIVEHKFARERVLRAFEVLKAEAVG
jgi:deoxyribodipyrimidine photo-lyase